MPQSRLECSRAVADRLDAAALFADLHRTLVDIAGAGLGACKSRLCVVEGLYLADGTQPRELAALDIGLIAGRSAAVKAALGDAVLALLRHHLAAVIAERETHLSVRLVDMAPTDYFKTVLGPQAVA
jgi:5-carboxymethyl-2-hydroxymuconate isomerase